MIMILSGLLLLLSLSFIFYLLSFSFFCTAVLYLFLLVLPEHCAPFKSFLFLFLGGVAILFFPSRTFYKTVGTPKVRVSYFHTIHWFKKQSIFHDQGCSTICSSSPYISY
jgi:hypothetical protein